jgi:hypothetical protein
VRKLHLLVATLTLGLAGCQPSGDRTLEPSETDPSDQGTTGPQAVQPAGGGMSGGGVVSDPVSGADHWGY